MLRTLKINAVTNEIHFRNRIYKTSETGADTQFQGEPLQRGR